MAWQDCAFYLWMEGKGSISEEYAGKNLVVIVAPHTSNWDGIFGVATVAGLDARITL